MNIDLRQRWWAIATVRELSARGPLARGLFGVPLVVFRDAAGAPAALADRCAHRHARLSDGCVRSGAIQCPYHGWRFDAGGRCVRIPGSEGVRPQKPLVNAYETCEAHGLVWVRCPGPRPVSPPPAPAGANEAVDAFFMVDAVACDLAEAAENFLDATHTHFVHAGWIRSDRARHPVPATVVRLEDGVEARYGPEPVHRGLIPRLLEGERGLSLGRFRLPGLAEIEYRDTRGRLTLLISAWLTPESETTLRVHARVATRRGALPAFLKQAVLKPLFAVVLRQDKRLLERNAENAIRFAASGTEAAPPARLDTAQDLLGPAIRRLLNGQPLGDEVERSVELRL